MTGQAELTWFLAEETGLIGSVRPMTGHAISGGKRLMCRFFLHFGIQFLVTVETEFTLGRTGFEQPGKVATMGVMARTAFTPGKRTVNTVSAFILLDIFMTVKAESLLSLNEQLFVGGLMGCMTVSAKSFLGRGMDLWSVGIFLPVVAGITKSGGLHFEQCRTCSLVTIMAGQALALADRGMQAASRVVRPGMTVQADFTRRSGQHAGIVAAVDGVTGPAVTILDRHVLCCCRAVFMTGQANLAPRGFYSDDSTFYLVTVITVPIFYRLMDDLLEQFRLVGAVLRVTVHTVCLHRVILVGSTEFVGLRLMAGSAEKVGFIVQQSGLISGVGVMTGKTALENRCVDMGLGEFLAIMTGKTEFPFSSLEKLGEWRVVRFMAGCA
jgi:hypothetical protein